MTPAPSLPTPRPGIADITPYRPGKATVEGVEHPVKLSANENILGCSPIAREAYLAALENMIGAPISAVGVGPRRDQTLQLGPAA